MNWLMDEGVDPKERIWRNALMMYHNIHISSELQVSNTLEIIKKTVEVFIENLIIFGWSMASTNLW